MPNIGWRNLQKRGEKSNQDTFFFDHNHASALLTIDSIPNAATVEMTADTKSTTHGQLFNICQTSPT